MKQTVENGLSYDINNNNYNFKHLDIREQFIWLMSNEDNFIINQLSDMILKLHSSRNDISFKYFNKDRIVLYQLFLFWSYNNFDTERASDKRMSLLLDIRFK
jgi:hypothetical protein